MNYSVFLGPNKRYIPKGKWDEYRDAKQLLSYDLVFRRHPQPGWYLPVLSNGKEDISLGTIFSEHGGEWGCIPNPDYVDKTLVGWHQVAVKRLAQSGFASRLRAAEYLMKVQEFTDPLGW